MTTLNRVKLSVIWKWRKVNSQGSLRCLKRKKLYVRSESSINVFKWQAKSFSVDLCVNFLSKILSALILSTREITARSWNPSCPSNDSLHYHVFLLIHHLFSRSHRIRRQRSAEEADEAGRNEFGLEVDKHPCAESWETADGANIDRDNFPRLVRTIL